MAIKSALITTVNGFLTSVITYLKHRDSMLSVINELYPVKVLDSNSLETYTTKNGIIITYNLSIVKQGRSVRINGSFTNNSALAILTGTTIFTFKANEYRGDTSYYLGVNAEYTPYLVKCVSPILPNQTVNFSIIINSDL